MTKPTTLAQIALLANSCASRARDIHEVQENWDLDELRRHLDKLAHIVESQGLLIADLASIGRQDWASAPTVSATLDLSDEGEMFRIRVRGAHGSASILLTDAELARLGNTITKMRERRMTQHEDDDLDRISCVKAGQPGHFGCGWCKEHNRPSFECLCNGARASVGERTQGPICENYACGLPVTHGESWYDKKRWWCDNHVPMSGHHEWCPTPCRDLVRAVTRPELWGVLEAGHAHLRAT